MYILFWTLVSDENFGRYITSGVEYTMNIQCIYCLPVGFHVGFIHVRHCCLHTSIYMWRPLQTFSSTKLQFTWNFLQMSRIRFRNWPDTPAQSNWFRNASSNAMKCHISRSLNLKLDCPQLFRWTLLHDIFAGQLNSCSYVGATSHSLRYFVDPVTGEHTNGIERCWRPFKEYVRKFGPIWDDAMDDYLYSWLFRFNRGRAGKSRRQIFDEILAEWNWERYM